MAATALPPIRRQGLWFSRRMRPDHSGHLPPPSGPWLHQQPSVVPPLVPPYDLPQGLLKTTAPPSSWGTERQSLRGIMIILERQADVKGADGTFMRERKPS